MDRREFTQLLAAGAAIPLTALSASGAPAAEAANPIGYFEFTGPNATTLARFYADVFGWKTTPGPFPDYHSVANDGGAGIPGGFRQETQPDRVLYIRVPNLEAAVAKVVAAGGKVLIPPTNVPGVVHFALFEDPQGNRTGVIT